MEVGLGDLVHGVFFCCQDYAAGKAALSDPETNEKLKTWGESVGKELVRLEGGKFVFDVESRALAFSEYLREGSGRPDLVPGDSDGRTPGAPLIQLLKLFLIEKMRMPAEAAMNYSFAEACHDFFAWHEQHGSAQIPNVEEAEQMAEFDEAGTSDEMLAKCLAALPGAKPLDQEKPAPKKKKRGARGV